MKYILKSRTAVSLLVFSFNKLYFYSEYTLRTDVVIMSYTQGNLHFYSLEIE